MYLGITLARLDDIDNACSAYDKALSIEKDHVFHLNYAATLYNAGLADRAKEQFDEFEALFSVSVWIDGLSDSESVSVRRRGRRP
jgi:Bardet-Biedl syndrome 4 protein